MFNLSNFKQELSIDITTQANTYEIILHTLLIQKADKCVLITLGMFGYKKKSPYFEKKDVHI